MRCSLPSITTLSSCPRRCFSSITKPFLTLAKKIQETVMQCFESIKTFVLTNLSHYPRLFHFLTCIGEPFFLLVDKIVSFTQGVLSCIRNPSDQARLLPNAVASRLPNFIRPKAEWELAFESLAKGQTERGKHPLEEPFKRHHEIVIEVLNILGSVPDEKKDAAIKDLMTKPIITQAVRFNEMPCQKNTTSALASVCYLGYDNLLARLFDTQKFPRDLLMRLSGPFNYSLLDITLLGIMKRLEEGTGEEYDKGHMVENEYELLLRLLKRAPDLASQASQKGTPADLIGLWFQKYHVPKLMRLPHNQQRNQQGIIGEGTIGDYVDQIRTALATKGQAGAAQKD